MTNHRGSPENIAEFAAKFIKGRLLGFSKDMRVCLTPIKSTTRDGLTHAYFPALAACCGLLEYMTSLSVGKFKGIGWLQVADWTDKYLSQPDYPAEPTRILFNAFRHPVAHRGIATGVWVDQLSTSGGGPIRVVWRVSAGSKRPACQLLPESGAIVRDSPWECRYTHRMHIHLKALAADLAAGSAK
jgi:hypothetical protein